MSRVIQGFGPLAILLCAAACGEGRPQPEACRHAPDEFADLPRITGFSPASGPPGATVIITGERFDRIDARFAVAYGDYAQTCVHATLEGAVRSATELEVVIPEDATLSGYLYLLADGRTVSRAADPFRLERDVATIVVDNRSQFPIVSAENALEPILEAGLRIDVEDAASFEVESGPMFLELCAGVPAEDGSGQAFACQTFEGRLSVGQVLSVTMAPIRAAHVLDGAWVGTWTVGEEVYEERLRVDPDGYWELRHGGRVVESGAVVEPARWPAYRTDFEFGLRPEDPPSEAALPLRTFSLYSPRAEAVIAFHRPES